MKPIQAFSVLAVALWTLHSPARGAADPVATQATIRYIPLPQRVRDSQIIVTGKVVKAELQTLQPGVDEVYCFIQIGSILKGRPRTVSTTVLGKSVPTVVIRFDTGPGVPGNYGFHAVADSGVWLLSLPSAPDHPVKGEQFKGSLYGGDMEPPNELDEIKRLLLPSGLPAPHPAP